jgi:hypothetical protein
MPCARTDASAPRSAAKCLSASETQQAAHLARSLFFVCVFVLNKRKICLCVVIIIMKKSQSQNLVMMLNKNWQKVAKVVAGGLIVRSEFLP